MHTLALGTWLSVCIVGSLLGAALGAVMLGGLPGLLVGALSGPLIGILLVRVVGQERPSVAWQQWSERLARGAGLLLLVVSGYGLIAGSIVAAVWQPDLGWDNLLLQLQDGGYLLVLVLSLPSLFVGAWYTIRGRWREGGAWLFPFVGPVIVFFVGQGLRPHLDGRWHQFVHTLSGSLPLTLLYCFFLRKWRPSSSKSPIPAGATSA